MEFRTELTGDSNLGSRLGIISRANTVPTCKQTVEKGKFNAAALLMMVSKRRSLVYMNEIQNTHKSPFQRSSNALF